MGQNLVCPRFRACCRHWEQRQRQAKSHLGKCFPSLYCDKNGRTLAPDFWLLYHFLILRRDDEREPVTDVDFRFFVNDVDHNGLVGSNDNFYF